MTVGNYIKERLGRQEKRAATWLTLSRAGRIGCGFPTENKIWLVFPDQDTLPSVSLKLGVPPLPHTSESLAGRGPCKNCLQNLDVKELRGQNLENKELGTTLCAICAPSRPRP